MVQSKRIGVLEFKEASYLGDKPSYDIVKWYSNPYCGNTGYKIYKDLFKSKELCVVLASFIYDSKEKIYNLEFIGARPLSLTNWDDFRKLIEYGYKQLNPKWYK